LVAQGNSRLRIVSLDLCGKTPFAATMACRAGIPIPAERHKRLRRAHERPPYIVGRGFLSPPMFPILPGVWPRRVVFIILGWLSLVPMAAGCTPRSVGQQYQHCARETVNSARCLRRPIVALMRNGHIIRENVDAVAKRRRPYEPSKCSRGKR
jgi:hypothetical protein